MQQVMTAPGVIQFREVPTPQPQPGEVLVKIMKIGVCGSDIHVYHGEHPFTKYPITQGHEVSGEIAALGEGVTGFTVGQKVTIQPQVVCGKCWPCRHGKYNLCEELKVMGFQTTGVASHYFAVDAKKVTPLPEGMSFDEGAMIEPLAVAVHAVRQAGDVEGKDICVLGAGPIGILVAQAAKGLGARKVMVTDVSDIRLEKARECGADVCVNTPEGGLRRGVCPMLRPGQGRRHLRLRRKQRHHGPGHCQRPQGQHHHSGGRIRHSGDIDLAVLNDHELDPNTDDVPQRGLPGRHRAGEPGQVQLKPLDLQALCLPGIPEGLPVHRREPETTMKVIINVQE